MYYVYLIKSTNFPEKIYVGYTTNLKQRFQDHNLGESIYTSKYRPWKLIMYLVFLEKTSAYKFEKYLKSQSGRAFINKRFLFNYE